MASSNRADNPVVSVADTGAMGQYRVLSNSGPTVVDAADDEAAFKIAERFLSGELHIWQGDRLVATTKSAQALVAEPVGHEATSRRGNSGAA